MEPWTTTVYDVYDVYDSKFLRKNTPCEFNLSTWIFISILMIFRAILRTNFRWADPQVLKFQYCSGLILFFENSGTPGGEVQLDDHFEYQTYMSRLLHLFLSMSLG